MEAEQNPDQKTGESTVIVERRAMPRFTYRAHVDIQIIIPEDTFKPACLDGTTMDISGRGMKLWVEKMPDWLCRKLLAGVRYARLSFEDPGEHKMIKLTGRIIWIDRKRTDPDSIEISCMFGVFFDSHNDDTAEFYRNFVRNIAENNAR
ncbi:MAG: PilZ domain-containing protein [bacterium]|nr:PilZ domain-containing protein [bacterium]